MTLAAYAKFCFELAAGVGLFMACQGAIHAELLVSVLLGQHQPEIVTILRIILLSLPFSIYFSLTQTLVDAWTPQGAVLRASVAALSINLAITLLLSGLVDISLGIGLPVGYAAASFVLWRYLTAQQKINTAWEQFLQTILINLALAALSVWVLMRSEEHSALFHLILFLVSSVAYGFICRLMHIGWYCRLENAVLKLSTSHIVR
jgi:O-antigen/teichoic acid export membrane protein